MWDKESIMPDFNEWANSLADTEHSVFLQNCETGLKIAFQQGRAIGYREGLHAVDWVKVINAKKN